MTDLEQGQARESTWYMVRGLSLWVFGAIIAISAAYPVAQVAFKGLLRLTHNLRP